MPYMEIRTKKKRIKYHNVYVFGGRKREQKTKTKTAIDGFTIKIHLLQKT